MKAHKLISALIVFTALTANAHQNTLATNKSQSLSYLPLVTKNVANMSRDNLVWNTFLGGLGADQPNAFIELADQSIVVVGNSEKSWGNPIIACPATTFECGFVARIDRDGNLIWNTFFGGINGRTHNLGVYETPDNKIVVTGGSNEPWGTPIRQHSDTTADNDIFVAKLDIEGRLIWSTFLGSNTQDDVGPLQIASNGNIYIAGTSTNSWGTPIRAYTKPDSIFALYDVFVAQINPSGELAWNTFVGGKGQDRISGMNLTNDNLIVLGTSNENWGNPQNPLALSGTQDGFLVEISTKGNLLWNTFFGGVGLDSVQMLEITNDQNLLVMGLSDESWGNPINPFTLNQNNIVIAKFDPSGKLLWNTFAGTIDPYSPATAMDTSKQTSDIFIASSWGSALVTKLDKNGNQLWNNRIGLQTNSVGSLEINSNNEIFICGGSASSN